jgi:Tat protein secretion system quality control protein TatD with DNase activity
LAGWHPWFSHHIAVASNLSKEEHYRRLLLSGAESELQEKQDAFARLLPTLPDPIPLETFLQSLRQRLKAFEVSILGEVGIDGAFRVPFADGEDAQRLSPFTILLEHQLALVEAQLAVAVELGKNVSFHSVRVPQPTVDLFERMFKLHGEKWKAINIDMHSCSLSREVLKRIQVSRTHVSHNA